MKNLGILSIFLVLVLAVSVSAAPSISNSVIPNEVAHNTRLDFTLTVITDEDVNNAKLSLLDANPLPQGTVVFNQQSIDLLAGQSTNAFPVTVNVPVNTAPGQYNINFVLWKDTINANGIYDAGEEVIPVKVVSFRVAVDQRFDSTLQTSQVTVDSGDDVNRIKRVNVDITNNGNVPLNGITVKFVKDNVENAIDIDGSFIRFSYPNGNSVNLAVRETKTVTVEINAEEGVDFSRSVGDFVITGGNPAVEQKKPFTVIVGDNVCEAGVKGNKLRATIEDPDRGDAFKPGEVIKLRVNVENRDDDSIRAAVEASVVNMDNGKRIDADTVEERIPDNDDKDFELQLIIDEDKVDDADNLAIFVKVYEDNEEETQCQETNTDVDVEKDDDDVRVVGMKLLPQTLVCGQSGEAIVELKNFGNDDQEVILRIVNSVLGISSESERFDLNADESSTRKTATIAVPKDAEAGDYEIEARVLYAGQDFSESVPLTVTCQTTAPQQSTSSNDDVKNVGVVVPTRPVETAQPTTVRTAPVTDKSIFDAFNVNRETPIALWVLADLILVLIVVFIIYLIVKRR